MDFDDGAILEIVAWLLPMPVAGCTHHFVSAFLWIPRIEDNLLRQ
ncbi:hypothetical protein [Candidatus Methylospira mobilis]|nr:hypothetical protein [Candidatus Methylospira mobilis]